MNVIIPGLKIVNVGCWMLDSCTEMCAICIIIFYIREMVEMALTMP